MSDRLYRRVSMNTEARVRTGSGELKCKVLDLSARGMSLETARGEALTPFVRITTDLGPGSPKLDLDAIVHGKKDREGTLRWSLEFHDPPPHVVSLIAAYVRERLAAELPEASHAEEEAGAASSQSAREADPEVQRLFDEALSQLG